MHTMKLWHEYAICDIQRDALHIANKNNSIFTAKTDNLPLILCIIISYADHSIFCLYGCIHICVSVFRKKRRGKKSILIITNE